MALTVVALPIPAGNGVGVAADVHLLDAQKSFCLDGTLGPSEVLTVQVTEDPAGLVGWTGLTAWSNSNLRDVTLNVVAAFVRVVRSGVVNATTPTASVAASTTSVNTYFNLPVPAVAAGTSGVGAAVDVSAGGQNASFSYDTSTRADLAPGEALVLEGSQDNVSFVGLVGFTQHTVPGFFALSYKFLRIRRLNSSGVAYQFFVGTSSLGAGGGAFPGFGGAPPAVAKGVASAAGVSATAARSDQGTGQFLVADWPLATCRTFLVDTVNGLQGNSGFSDVAGPYDPATQAVNSLAALTKVFPSHFAGRKFRIIVAGALVEPLSDLLEGITGFQPGSCIKATGALATAGAVAFADDAADQIAVGAVTATGTNAAGYNPIGALSATVIQMQKNGGGAAALPAEPASPLMWRIRFDSATTTVALRNACQTVTQVSGTDTVTVPTALPAVPVGSDIFYLEQAGVTFPATSLTTRGPQTATTSGLTFVGLRCTGAWVFGQGSNVAVFCGSTGLASFNDCASWRANNNYTDPQSGVLRTVGGGFRAEAGITTQGGQSDSRYDFICSVGLFLILNSVMAQSVNPIVCSAGFTIIGLVENTRAILGGSGNSKIRVIAPGVIAGIDWNGSHGRLAVVDITGSGNKPAIAVRGLCELVLTNTITGATGNTDVGLDVSTAAIPGFGSTIILESQPTVTGALGDVRVGGGIIITWAQAFAGFIDANGTRFIGAKGPLYTVARGSCVSGNVAIATTNYLDNAASIGGGSAAPFRWPTSQRLVTRIRLGTPTGTGANPPTLNLIRYAAGTGARTVVMTCTLPAGAPAGTQASASGAVFYADGDGLDLEVTQPIAIEGAAMVTAIAEGP